MKKYKKDKYERIFEKYKESQLIAYCTPDQYQFRQNELIKELAEFILTPYFKWKNEQVEDEEEDLND
jgi:predicted protein tyrosine phosphatase